MQLRLLWVGKTRNPHLKALCEDYLERVCHLVSCEVVELRDAARARATLARDLRLEEGRALNRFLPPGCRVAVLDSRGQQLTSDELARWFEEEQRRGTRDIRFVVGGAEGIDEDLGRRAHLVLSFGRVTWTHEMARLLLLEQVYRAFTILRGIPYHK